MIVLRRWRDNPIPRQIAVLVTGLLLIVGLAISLVSYIQVLQLTRESASERLRVLGSQLAPLLSRGPLESLTRLTRAASNPALARFVTSDGADGRAAAIATLGATLQTTPTSATVVADAAGKTLLDLGPPQRGPWFGPPPEGTATSPADSAAHVGPFVRLDDTTLFVDTRSEERR